MLRSKDAKAIESSHHLWMCLCQDACFSLIGRRDVNQEKFSASDSSEDMCSDKIQGDIEA